VLGSLGYQMSPSKLVTDWKDNHLLTIITIKIKKMNKETHGYLIEDAYKRFLNETIKIEPVDAKQRAIEQLLNSKESVEEFINKIKTDDEFAKKWR
jgi:hypothetical protein